MQRTIRRLGAGIVTGLAFFAFSAAPAFAMSVTTEPASHVETTSAVLNGVIDTDGAATIWQFVWGRTSQYGRSTPTQFIPAGGGKVAVSWRLDNLTPNTRYHFRLVAAIRSRKPYYRLKIKFGCDLTFKTEATSKHHHQLTATNDFMQFGCRAREG